VPPLPPSAACPPLAGAAPPLPAVASSFGGAEVCQQALEMAASAQNEKSFGREDIHRAWFEGRTPLPETVPGPGRAAAAQPNGVVKKTVAAG
jgi:hypothetical protein